MSRRKNPNLKKAYTEESYTKEQLEEMQRCIADPKYFIKNYVYIKHPVKGRIKFDLYDYQDEMVDLYHSADLSIVLSARQTGKTESICAYLLWYAIFHDEVTILIASNKSSSAMELIAKIQDVYEYLPHWLKPGINDDSWNKHECKFDNKSRIVSSTTSKDSGRGLSITLLYCDEFAFVPANMQEEFWTSIQPTLSCLRGDTLVYTNDGLIPIEQFHTNRKVGDYFELKDVNTWGRGGNEKVSHGYVSPEGKTRVITNSWGMEVEATLNHPFFVAGNDTPYMKPTKELTNQDYIRIDCGMKMFGKQHIDADLAHMLGGYIAEGWANGYSTQLAERYEQLGVNLDAKCHDKRTPTSIMRGTKSTVCNYLAGLFDGDGSVTDRAINLTSTSKRLIQETQLLLLNLGIVSKVSYVSGGSKSIANKKNVTTSYKDAWSLNIPLSQYNKFNSIINLRIKRKKEKLLEISKKIKHDDHKQFTIPASIVRDTIKNIIEQADISGYTLRKNHGISIDKVLDHSKSDRSITVQWFRRFSDLIKKESPSTWERHKNFFTEYSEKCSWVKISKIEESYQKVTYDFTVPKSHSFLQSGFMGSNTGGRCIISSTPNGNSNKFAQLWRGAKNKTNDFQPMHVPWDAPPGRDEAFKKKQIGLLGKRKWLQEFECEFLSAEVTLIDSYILNQIEEKMDLEFLPNGGEPPVAVTVGDLVFFKKINRDMTYLVGVDVSSGNGNDFSVITVVEFPTMEQVLEFRSNKLSERFLYARLKNILLFLQQNCEEVYFSIENNGLGASMLALYEFDTNPPKSAYLISEENNSRLGLAMSEATKRRAALKFKNMIESRTYKFYSLALLEEMKSYTRQGATYKAEAGATDDSIAAHLIIMRIIEEMAEYNHHAYDKIYNTAGHDDNQQEWDAEFTDEPRSLDDMPMPISFG